MTSDQMRAEAEHASRQPELSPEEMDYIDSLSGDSAKNLAVHQLQTMNYARLHNFVHWLRDRNGE
jgi:hypothetical protein